MNSNQSWRFTLPTFPFGCHLEFRELLLSGKLSHYEEDMRGIASTRSSDVGLNIERPREQTAFAMELDTQLIASKQIRRRLIMYRKHRYMTQ